MQITATAEHEGQRLDAVLAGPLGTRTRAVRLIAAGAVSVDGRSVPKSHVVVAGQEIEVDDTIEPERPEYEIDDSTEPAEYGTVFEDEYLLVVDKPAGVVVHPARGNRFGTLAQALDGKAAGGDDQWRAGIVHRLDKDTSGLLVVAKSELVHARLKAALQRRDITREYLALVQGRPPSRSGTIDAPIGRDRRVRTKMSTDTDRPREARTDFVLERALPQTSLLRVRLQTGRTHQIRVHLEAIGHPVCGDPEYGEAGLLGLTRQFLHATRLAFDHPISGEHLDNESPLPADLQAALELAERH
jgi:23S rRNA pseudouridine1911/1915/1917 synthase